MVALRKCMQFLHRAEGPVAHRTASRSAEKILVGRTVSAT
jgi:hypothetical protein